MKPLAAVPLAVATLLTGAVLTPGADAAADKRCGHVAATKRLQARAVRAQGVPCRRAREVARRQIAFLAGNGRPPDGWACPLNRATPTRGICVSDARIVRFTVAKA